MERGELVVDHAATGTKPHRTLADNRGVLAIDDDVLQLVAEQLHSLVDCLVGCKHSRPATYAIGYRKDFGWPVEYQFDVIVQQINDEITMSKFVRFVRSIDQFANDLLWHDRPAG